MKFVDEYRDGTIAGKIAREIRNTVTRPWVLMEICGGQTHSIVKYGVDYLLMPAHRPALDPLLTGEVVDPRFVLSGSVPGSQYTFYAIKDQAGG